MKTAWSLALLALAACSTLVGCGGGTCVAGTQISCACTGGGSGTQLCNALGTGYEACTGCATQNPYTGRWGRVFFGPCQLDATEVDASGAFGSAYPNCSGASVTMTGHIDAQGQVTGKVMESRAGEYTLTGSCTTTSFCSGTGKLTAGGTETFNLSRP